MLNLNAKAMFLFSALLLSQATWAVSSSQIAAYEPSQICHMGVRASNSNPNEGIAWTTCQQEGPVDLYVFDARKKTVLCREHFPSSWMLLKQCTFERNPSEAMEVKIEVHASGEYFSTKQTIQKPATFEYPVTAKFDMVSTQLIAKPQKKELPRRGIKYASAIKVFVEDLDIRSSDPQKEILVELVDAKTGLTLQKEKVSTKQTVTFEVSAFYEKPRFVGQEGWLKKTELQPGKNELLVVVHDAYKANTKNTLTLEPIIIEVPEQPNF